MSLVTSYLLVDGAVLQNHALMQKMKDSNAAISLYVDLGEDARQVGPWLWPGASLEDVGDVELPARHGVSVLRSNVGIAELRVHFENIRHIETHDGQRYFFRYADMRALAATHLTLDDAQWTLVAGPIQHWAFIDRHGKQRVMVDGLCKTSYRSKHRLRLTAKQLATLLNEGLPDQLCLAVEELDEPQLAPSTNAQQFDWLEPAAQLIRREGIEVFTVQRAIARQAILFGDEAIKSVSFLKTVRAAKRTRASDAVDTWSPELGSSENSDTTP